MNSVLLAKDRLHDRDHAVPLRFLARELAPAGSRELIETRSSIVVRDVPLRPHQASLFHAHQGRIERSHIETDGTTGDLLETRCDGIAVRWSKRGQSLQEHEVERA